MCRRPHRRELIALTAPTVRTLVASCRPSRGGRSERSRNARAASKFGVVAAGPEGSSRSDLADLVPGAVVLTLRLEVRLPRESDRARFVELLCDDDFMVFSSGVLTADAAHDRFDKMLVRAAELAFAKQPVIEQSTGIVVGYAGVDWLDFEGRRRLEFGYRLVPEARGVGYATEASRALLGRAAETYRGEILATIDPNNRASQNVARKLGFTFWKRAIVDGYLDNIYLLGIDSADAVPPE
jgi:RimJ/RimL family protein N-acetyltransferase